MFVQRRAPFREGTVLALSSTPRVVVAAVLLIGIIAFIDQRTAPSFGLLYLFPIILVGTVLARWQVVFTAAVCAWLTALFNRYAFGPSATLAQDALVFTALAGTGLVAHELTRSRRREIEHRQEVEREAAARREAQEQLTFLVNTSPAAIVTMSADGCLLLANAAAHRLFGAPAGQLAGRHIGRYIPSLGRVPFTESASQAFQTEMQCRGEREDGSVFLANVFFSTYNTVQGRRLAALIVDSSAELLEREESSLEELLAGSRILVAAVSHEVRNLCGAMAIIYENLARKGQLANDKDFEGLGALVDALTRIASVQLKPSAETSRVAGVDLVDVLNDLRIVLDRYCEEAGIAVEWQWDVSDRLPAVWADRRHLLQVLLNLAKNSRRALEKSAVKQMAISVSAHAGAVSIRVSDSGPGLASAHNLFQPFQKGAAATGLGLYLSRALLRAFHGDLRHDPTVRGCSFVIDLATVDSQTGYGTRTGTYDDHSLIAG